MLVPSVVAPANRPRPAGPPLAELIDDAFTRETVLDIALQYQELAEHADRRQRGSD